MQLRTNRSRISSKPEFVLQAKRYTTNRYIGLNKNVYSLEALFEYYRQLPGQPDVWYGIPTANNAEQYYGDPAFIDGRRTRSWAGCYRLENTLLSGESSTCTFTGMWTKPDTQYGVQDGRFTEIHSRWGRSGRGHRDIHRDFLNIKFDYLLPLCNRETFFDIIYHVYVLWRSDIVGIVDINSVIARERTEGDTGWIDRMVIGIVDGEAFIRPELEDFFEGMK